MPASFVYATLQFAGHQFLVTRLYAERREAPLWLGEKDEVRAEQAGRRFGGPIVAGLVAFAVLALGIGAVMVSRLELHEGVLVTAHRGASLQAPENSLAAFRAASRPVPTTSNWTCNGCATAPSPSCTTVT